MSDGTLKPFSEARFVFLTTNEFEEEALERLYGIHESQLAAPHEAAKAIWLGPRSSGDYKEHLALRLKRHGFRAP